MDLKLPDLGEGAYSGTVVNLFVKEGDQITKDQPILELENEKAVATIPSTAAGTVTKIFVKTGDKVSVGQRLPAGFGSRQERSPRSRKRSRKRKRLPKTMKSRRRRNRKRNPNRARRPQPHQRSAKWRA